MSRLWPLLLPLAALVAWLSGAGAWLSWSELGRHQAALRDWAGLHQALAALLYVAIYTALVGLSVPLGAALTLLGGLLFGVSLGAALAVTGASAGAVVLFLLARGTLGRFLAARAGSLIERFRPTLQRDGFWGLLALRLIPAMPFWLTNLAPALLGMPLLPFTLATVIGITPATAVIASLGAGLGDVLARGERPDLSVLLAPSVVLPLVGLAVLSLLPIGVRRWRARHA